MKWFWSLRWKLFILFFIVSYVPILFFSSVLMQTIESYYIGVQDTEVLRQANLVASQIKDAEYLKEGSNYTYFNSEMERLSRPEQTNSRIVVVDSLGYVVADSSRANINSSIIDEHIFKALTKKQSSSWHFERNGKMTMSTAVPVVDKEDADQILGAVILTSDVEELYESLGYMRVQVNLLSLITALIVGLLSFFTSSFITKPLKILLKFVERVTNGQLDHQIDVKGRDDIAELGHAFNHMVKQLQRVEHSRQEFVSNVSHELKTPLSSIKVLTDSLMHQQDVPVEVYQEFFGDINSEVDRLNDIISDLLTLVRYDQKEIPLNIQEINLAKMVESIIKRLSPLAHKKEISMTYNTKKEVWAEIDEVKLTLALSNLIENAIKYTPEQGSVDVVLDYDSQYVTIKVQDTGIGIAKEDQSKIFERFYRTDKTRSRETGGTGLGLSITHRAVIMHGGMITIESEEGVGSTFIVHIPIKNV